MIVIYDGEKWYTENFTHYEPMSSRDFERFGQGAYDYRKMAQVEHYSADVCYSYFPVALQSGIPINQTDYKVLWCFSLTRQISSKARYHAGEQHSVHVYLTTDELQTLYKDPKSIWEESQKWAGDTDD